MIDEREREREKNASPLRHLFTLTTFATHWDALHSLRYLNAGRRLFLPSFSHYDVFFVVVPSLVTHSHIRRLMFLSIPVPVDSFLVLCLLQAALKIWPNTSLSSPHTNASLLFGSLVSFLSLLLNASGVFIGTTRKRSDAKSPEEVPPFLACTTFLSLILSVMRRHRCRPKQGWRGNWEWRVDGAQLPQRLRVTRKTFQRKERFPRLSCFLEAYMSFLTVRLKHFEWLMSRRGLRGRHHGVWMCRMMLCMQKGERSRKPHMW